LFTDVVILPLVEINMPVSTKAQRSAKAQARARRESQQSIIGIAAVVIIVFVALIVALVSQTRNSIQIDQGIYAGIPQSTTADGAPIMGDPNAKIMVMEVLDFSCPHCAEYHPYMVQLIKDYVKPGKAQLLVRPVTFVGGQFSVVAATGALCAGKQNAFWPMHDELFNIQLTEGYQAFTLTRMQTAAAKFKLDLAAFGKCLASGETNTTLSTTEQVAQQLGANSTPSLLYSLDGGKTFQWWKDNSQADMHGGIPLDVVENTINQANGG
jgi:protein-disulfide isomerase